MKTTFRSAFPQKINLITIITSMVVITSPIQASIMGVTGDSGYGNMQQNSFYEIDTDSGEAILIGGASITPNQLAYDRASTNYYYMDHIGTDFYRFNTATGTEHYIADLTGVGMPTGKTGSGGGDFYGGKYYYTPETGTESIYAISFNSDGSQIINHTPISPNNLSDFSDLINGSYAAGLGDFGDFAIDRNTGLLYGSSRLSKAGSTYQGFWTIDLTDPSFPMTMINDQLNSVYQLAFDQDNKLWANRWGTKGDLYEISKADGTVLAIKPTQVDAGSGLVTTNGDFFDLGSTGLRDGVLAVPEPSSLSLLGLSFILLFKRNRQHEHN